MQRQHAFAMSQPPCGKLTQAEFQQQLVAAYLPLQQVTALRAMLDDSPPKLSKAEFENRMQAISVSTYSPTPGG